MAEGILFYFTKPDINRPIEEQYVTEIRSERKSFVHQEDAMLYLFDNGVRKFNRLTKELHEYKDIRTLPVFEFIQVENRVGYVVRDYLPQLDKNNEIINKRVFIWRFIGFGRTCTADTKDELMEQVNQAINEYNNAPEELGCNSYPYYTKNYRNNDSLKHVNLTLDLF